jgi:hypothetical protein
LVIIPCVTMTVKEDVIQYAFRNGQIVKKAATGDALGKTFMMWNSLKRAE